MAIYNCLIQRRMTNMEAYTGQVQIMFGNLTAGGKAVGEKHWVNLTTDGF